MSDFSENLMNESHWLLSGIKKKKQTLYIPSVMSETNYIKSIEILAIFSGFFKYKFVYFNWRLITLQYCIGFAIHHHESATGNTCSPSWTPLPPSSLPAPSLWVVPVHQPQASSIMHRTWTSSYLILMHCSCFWEEVLHFSILLNKEYVVDFFL